MARDTIPSSIRAAVLMLGAAALLPQTAGAQGSGGAVVGAGAGGTYYCIVSRCGTGEVLVAAGGYGPASFLLFEGGVRWHGCPDCSRFLIAEVGAVLRYPGNRFSPFVALGGGLSSDPDFMGDEAGLHAAVGTWYWVSRSWGMRVEARGRQVGRGDHMGEASVGVAYRFARPGR